MKQYKFFEVIFNIAGMSDKIKLYQDMEGIEKVYKLIDKIQIKIEANNRLFEDYKYFENINVNLKFIAYIFNTIEETILNLENAKFIILYAEAYNWSEFGIIGEYLDKVKYIIKKLKNLKGFVARYIEE